MTVSELEQTIEAELPPVGLMVLVQCEGFCCLAYRTDRGKWIAAFGGEELKDVIHVFPWEEPTGSVVPIRLGAKPRSERVPIRVCDESISVRAVAKREDLRTI